jgi:hypothetical protein
MISNLEGQLLFTQARRSVKFDISVPMARRFHPRLARFEMPHGANALYGSEVRDALPGSGEDISFAPLTHLSHWIAAGMITSRRLTEIYLARIEMLSPKLECYAAITADLADADAMYSLSKAGVNLSPLPGIPYGLKELFITKGIVTRWGQSRFGIMRPNPTLP